MYLRMMVESTRQQAVCIPWEMSIRCFIPNANSRFGGILKLGQKLPVMVSEGKNPDSITLLSSLEKKKKKVFSGNNVILLVF